MTRSLPSGQRETLLALSAAMFRGVLLAGVAVGGSAVVVAGVLAGAAGALSALAGVVMGLLASLMTLWLMRRTAAREPRAVMLASFSGSLQKAIFLLIALFGVGAIGGVHRASLSGALLAVLIATAAAEGWAGYRLRTSVVDPATSAEPTGMSDSAADGPAAPDGRPTAPPARPDSAP